MTNNKPALDERGERVVFVPPKESTAGSLVGLALFRSYPEDGVYQQNNTSPIGEHTPVDSYGLPLRENRLRQYWDSYKHSSKNLKGILAVSNDSNLCSSANYRMRLRKPVVT